MSNCKIKIGLHSIQMVAERWTHFLHKDETNILKRKRKRKKTHTHTHHKLLHVHRNIAV